MDVDRYIFKNHGSCDMCEMSLLEQGEKVATNSYVSYIDYLVADQNRIDLLKEQEALQKELGIYKPSSSIQEFLELECLSERTPKQINGIFHKLHDETLTMQKRIDNLEAEKLEVYKVLIALGEGDVPENYTDVSNKAQSYIDSIEG